MKLCINTMKYIGSFWSVSANNVTSYLERDIMNNTSSEEQKRKVDVALILRQIQAILGTF